MNPAKLEVLEAIKQKRIYNARRDLLSFIRYTKPDYKVNWHHRYAASRLDDVGKGLGLRIMVGMPPRRGKTEIIGRRLPPFLFGRDPSLSILYTTHTASLSMTLNREVQRIMLSGEYKDVFPDTRIQGAKTDEEVGKRTQSEFEIVGKGGRYRNTGVGQAISGEGFNVLLLDDFLREAADADSPPTREGQWEWYTADFWSRRAPGADIIILGTPRHPDDIMGRLKRMEREDPHADKWEYISFPELCDYEEQREPKPAYDIRNEGEVLWPERYPLEDALAARAQNAFQFSALYQQRPALRDGNVVKRSWFPVVHVHQDADMVDLVLYGDLGASDNPNADSTVLTVKAKLRDGKERMLWQHAGQWNPKQRNEEIIRFCSAWRRISTTRTPYPNMRYYIEAGFGMGAEGVDALQKQLLANGIPVTMDKPTTGKVIRADSFLASAEANQIEMYVGNEYKEIADEFGYQPMVWVENFFNETTRLQFKEGARGVEFVGGHDDRLDSAVGAHNKLTKPRTKLQLI